MHTTKSMRSFKSQIKLASYKLKSKYFQKVYTTKNMRSFKLQMKLVSYKLKSKHHFAKMQLTLVDTAILKDVAVMKSDIFITLYVPKLLPLSLSLVFGSAVWSNLCYSLWYRESALRGTFHDIYFFFSKPYGII